MPYAMTSRICQNLCWQNPLRPNWKALGVESHKQVQGGGGGSMKELWPLEENRFIKINGEVILGKSL